MKRIVVFCLVILLFGCLNVLAQEVKIDPGVSLSAIFGKEEGLKMLIEKSLKEVTGQLKAEKIILTQLDFSADYIYGGDDYVYPLVIKIKIFRENQTQEITFLNKKGLNFRKSLEKLVQEIEGGN